MTEETDLADRYIKAFITNMIHILKDIKENSTTLAARQKRHSGINMENDTSCSE